MNLLQLTMVCAPMVAPNTMMAVIHVESRGNPWAIGNPSRPLARQPTNYQDAVFLSKKYIELGHNIDMGLAQVNAKTARRLGVSVEQLFDPCMNLSVAGVVLQDNYIRATKRYGPGQQALLAAISTYNTGSMTRGWSNGYVRRIVGAATRTLSSENLYPRSTPLPP